jgi:hypothetical protein
MLYPHLAGRLFGVPLLIHRPKLDVILSVLAPRLGLDGTLPQAALPSPRPVASPTPGIAILPIHGSLVRRTLGMEAESGLLSYQAIQSGLAAALADPNVAGILLDVDSPGGEAGGVFDLADRIACCGQGEADLGHRQRVRLLGGLCPGQRGLAPGGHAHVGYRLGGRDRDAHRPVRHGCEGGTAVHADRRWRAQERPLAAHRHHR